MQHYNTVYTNCQYPIHENVEPMKRLSWYHRVVELATWLQARLTELGWSQAELSRRSGVSAGQISKVLNGDSRAGADFCVAISAPLGVEPYVVLKLAGYLPKSYEPRRDILTQLLEAAASLPDEEIDELVALARVKRGKNAGGAGTLSPRRDAVG